MKCADIMSRNLEWLTETSTIDQAAKTMAETGIGFLPICDSQGRVIGVVTDRDLTTRALAKDLDSKSTSAAMVMSAPVLTCLEATSVADAEALMAQERKSRLVVTDAAGRVTGILSLADLVEHAPGKKTLETIRAILWREALGPRAGAPKGEPLLKDDPLARSQPLPPDGSTQPSNVFTGGHWRGDTKEFPG
jgi:CBS domain-containing protein